MSTRFLIPSDALEIDNILLGSFVTSIVQEGGLGGLVVCFENGGREARLGVRMSIWMAEGICRASKPNKTTGLSAGPNDCLHSGIRLVQARPGMSGAVVCLT